MLPYLYTGPGGLLNREKTGVRHPTHGRFIANLTFFLGKEKRINVPRALFIRRAYTYDGVTGGVFLFIFVTSTSFLLRGGNFMSKLLRELYGILYRLGFGGYDTGYPVMMS